MPNGKVTKEKSSMTPKREHRFVKQIAVRQRSGKGPLIYGYAAMFNSLSHPLGGFREKIAPGAFAKAIAQDDVRALVGHDPDKILGRNKAGTLTLREDDRGLYCEIQPPDTTAGRDVVESIKRGDLDGMSFGFGAVDEDWTTEDGQPLRELREVSLFDVSVVTYPAYPETSVSMRSLLFPDGLPPTIEQHEERDVDSLEDQIGEVNAALAKAFPAPARGENSGLPVGYGKYWIMDTFPDHVIVSDSASGEYFSISYQDDEANETITFGEPVPVEKEWVPSPRSLAKVKHRKLRAEKRDMRCDCMCPECQAGNCDECSDPKCDDPNCKEALDESGDIDPGGDDKTQQESRTEEKPIPPPVPEKKPLTMMEKIARTRQHESEDFAANAARLQREADDAARENAKRFDY